MVELEDGVANKLGIPSKIYFITDELAVMRNRNGAKRVCDLLAMRVDAEGKCIPMLIELKSDRLKSELTTQSKSYSEAFEILEQHLQGFSKIYSKLSGQTVEFVEPRLEPWIIWPFRSDKAAKKEIGKNINVIEYDDNGDGGYSFI